MLINCVCNSILRRRRWYVRSNDVRYWKLKINEQSRNEPLTWIIVRVNISRVSQTLFILHSVSTRHNISIFSPCSSWKVFAFGYLKLKFMPTNERTKNRKVACWWIRSNISIRFNECFVSFPAPISSSFTALFFRPFIVRSSTKYLLYRLAENGNGGEAKLSAESRRYEMECWQAYVFIHNRPIQ